MTQIYYMNQNLSLSAEMIDIKRLNSSVNEGYRAYKYLMKVFHNEPLGNQKDHCVNRLYKGYEHYLYKILITYRNRLIELNKNPMKLPPLGHIVNDKIPPWVKTDTVIDLYKKHIFTKDPNYYNFLKFDGEAKSGYLAPDKNGKWQIYMSGYSKIEENKIINKFLTELNYEK